MTHQERKSVPTEHNSHGGLVCGQSVKTNDLPHYFILFMMH